MGLIFFAFFENFFVPILTSGGYVGLSIATLLSQHHQVTAVDIVPEKVELINNRKSPIQDDYIEKYLAEKELNLIATLDAKTAYADADFVVIAAPTNYDSRTQHFDTSAVEAVIELVMEYNPNAIMVIKSTIPVAIGLLLIVCSIIPYFSDLYEDTFFYKNWPYAVMYMLICFLCATYRCLNNMLNLIFKLDDDLPHSLIREESDVKKDLDRRLQKQQSACGKGGH